MASGYLQSPIACNIRFFATALEKTLENHIEGGTGYLTINFMNNKKMQYHGHSTNESEKLHCYYMTNKGFGAEFLDTPKTLSIVVSCPVILDDEIGPYNFRNTMRDGYYCRVLSDIETQVSLHLRPSSFEVPLDYAREKHRYVRTCVCV